MKILLATNCDHTQQMLSQELLACGHLVEVLALTMPLAQRLAKGDIELLLLAIPQASYPLLTELASLIESQPMPVLLFVKQSGSVVTDDVLASGISSYVIDGLVASRVGSVVEVACARFKQLYKLRADMEHARRSLAERKMIERAKGILMRQKGCSEEDAYRSLRTTAMNQNKRLVDVADDVMNVMGMLS